MNSYDGVYALIEQVRKNGGGTFLVDFDHEYGRWVIFDASNTTTGYYVSAPNGIENLPDLDDNTFRAVLVAFLGDRFGAREIDDPFRLGLWQDENGNWSIDETLWFYNYDVAMSVARENNQRAIYDIRDQEVLSVERKPEYTYVPTHIPVGL